MGNKILGRRSRTFYKGFNQKQVQYIKQKFETISNKGVIDKVKFIEIYQLDQAIADKFLQEVDYDGNAAIDQYQFICMAHSLCSQTIQQLGGMIYRILTKNGSNLTQQQLLQFTKICIRYNNYLQRVQEKENDVPIAKINQKKFKKYDADKNKVIDQAEFVKICLKDQDYKLWMYNMGFISKRQMDYQEDIYDLVDSDIGDQIQRQDRGSNANLSNIKMGIQHRINDDDFQVEQDKGVQSTQNYPWVKQSKKIQIQNQNLQPPNQSLQIQYVFGYRSFDCRNNLKFDSKGRVVYHQAAIGIVLEPSSNNQNFLIEHRDDITCLDVVQDTVVTGQTGAKPMIMVWQTNKKEQSLQKRMIISKKLQDGINCVCLSESRTKIATICNDTTHRLVVYDIAKLQKKQNDPTSNEDGVIAFGQTSSNVPFDLKFGDNEKKLVLATLKQILFIEYEKGKLNSNRGDFADFTVSPTLCLLSLTCQYKGDSKKYMVSGMGNGSIYFWEKEKCVKSIFGHKGSVSSICSRKDTKSFISGDRTGLIIIWNDKFDKEKTIAIPKTNSISNMIVSLSCNKNKEILIGSKSSQIYILKIGDSFDKAKKIMSGHSDGQLWGLAVHKSEDIIYTGGDDQRLIKWEYTKKRSLLKQRKCSYPIRSIDLYDGTLQNAFLAVGYKNGVVQIFEAQNLQSSLKKYTGIKNPDQEVLNLVKINKDGTICAACYMYPTFKIALLNIAKKDKNQIQVLSQIKLDSKVIAIDFNKDSDKIRFNTSKYEYFSYRIYSDKDQFKNPIKDKQINSKQVWATHTLPYSPQTQGVYGNGVIESDIISCCRTRKYFNVFVVGDKYSKIKLFNYPSKQNKIYNKYVGHSNEVTSVQFNRRDDHLISIGGAEKSIIVWKYNNQQIKNAQFLLKNMDPPSDNEQIDQERLKKKKLLQEYDKVGVVGEQALATKAYAGQIKNPSDFKEKYDVRRDNRLPKQNLSIHHVFGLRNKYIGDQVRNQVNFTSDYKSIVFPTACLGVKMSIQSKNQQFLHAHRQDIVSFAIDPSRKILATGQMAEKNAVSPKRKIVCIYVWDLNGNKVLQKLDGFHTIAVVLLSFSPNSKLLFSCGNDEKNSYAIYDWISGSIIYSGPVSRGKVNGISWKTNEQFITCGMDHVKFWSGPKSLIGKLEGKFEPMFSCASSKKIYISGSGDGGLYNWIGNRSSKKINAHKGKVHSIVFFNDFIYSGGDDGVIKAWRTQSNGEIKSPQQFFDTRSAYQELLKTVKNIPQQQFGILSIDFSDKRQLIVGTYGASVIYYNGKKTEIIQQGHYKGQLWALSTQVKKGGDNYILTGCDDKSVRIWDISNRKQINRVYFDNKIRGIDWSNDGSRIVIGDSKAQIFLYNNSLTSKLDQYKGKPFSFNQSQKKDKAFIQDIKFSPNNKMIAYGCHGKSLYMEILNVLDSKLKLKSCFQQGTSALLHVDWSRDSQFISINSQAYELLFYDSNGKSVTASALADQKWATWTRKIGFQSKGVFQGVDYTDVNTVCRDPNSQFIAVGYDDQCIRLFKYPCYIEKQVCKVFPGHSSHVTRVKFTSDYLVSVGGLDRTIMIWNIERDQDNQQKQQEDADLQQDVDVPVKAIKRKNKDKQIQQFYQNEEQGDQFLAVKPWLGTIKQPTYEYPKETQKQPNVQLKLEYVHGYRVKDCRQNLFYCDKETIIFHAAAVLIYHNIQKNQQTILDPHGDDIISIDYHKQSNQVITGQLGPKPLVCLFKNGKHIKTFVAPVKKGVLAIAISPDGKKAACAGMDDDHHISVLDLQNGTVLATTKGTKKIITKMIWVSNINFVTIGISHYKYWTYEKNSLQGKQSSKRQNMVSIAYDEETGKIFTGGSKGTIIVWNGAQSSKEQINLQKFVKVEEEKSEQRVSSSVVDCLLIQKNLLLAGTKDGLLYVIDKKSSKVLNQIDFQELLSLGESQKQEIVRSNCPGIRAINIIQNKLIIGTLGSQIYQFLFRDLTSKNPPVLKYNKNILKCHYSPNNTWTNQVWGLCVHNDYLFTCSDDATVRCWSIRDRKLLSCTSTNNILNNGKPEQIEKNKKTNDFEDISKSRSVCVSPDGKHVIVGSKTGLVRIFQIKQKQQPMKLIHILNHAKQEISDIKCGFNLLIVGSHDNAIYVYDYDDGQITRKYAPLKKHSSYIRNFDVSKDSCFLQSTCGAYELLYWDLNKGKQITAGGTFLKDERWGTWTCNLGWPVQGIYPKCTDGTFINSVSRSNLSVNNTLYSNDKISPYLVAVGNDNGKVCVYNYPSLTKGSKYVEGKGHSSHVTNVKWSDNDEYLFSVGGEDQCLMYWKVSKGIKKNVGKRK